MWWGRYRRVYAHGSRPDWVVKIGDKHPRGPFCNRLERDRWAARETLGLADWLCPVIACAEDGTWLVMAKADQSNMPRRPPDHPAHVRALKDTTISNWALLDGRPVLIDYGYPGD